MQYAIESSRDAGYYFEELATAPQKQGVNDHSPTFKPYFKWDKPRLSSIGCETDARSRLGDSALLGAV